MSDEDLFEDEMKQTHGQWESMESIQSTKVTPSKQGDGMTVQFHCPACAAPRGITVSWVEIYCIAHLVNPQAIGVTTPYQANRTNTTGFGPVIPCRCGHREAPFTLSYEECKRYFYDYANAFRNDPNVKRAFPMVTRLLRPGFVQLQ